MARYTEDAEYDAAVESRAEAARDDYDRDPFGWLADAAAERMYRALGGE
jgi:hypothetical protein